MQNNAKEIATEYKAKGKNGVEIAETLNGLGYTTVTGRPWTDQTVRLLLKGPQKKKKRTTKATATDQPVKANVGHWTDVTADYIVFKNPKTKTILVSARPKS